MHTPIDKISPSRYIALLFAAFLLAGTAPACGKSSLAPDIEEGLVEKIIAAEGYFDGPYILYEGDQATVVRVTPTTEGALLTQETVTAEELKAGPIDVIPTENGEDGLRLKPFQVRLFDYETTDQWDFDQPEKIFAISDIECSFSNTEAILRAGGVIDEDYNWIYGNNHLVVNGDMFSRGYDMMALLWLLYKLDDEARQVGGRVHIIIGNHEAMNLRSDVRYVRPRYLEFVEAAGIPYIRLFDENTELGRWLRTKHTIIRIGRNLVVHGGISPQFLELGLSPVEVNRIVRRDLGKQTAELDEVSREIFGSLGPHWYRGMVHTTEDRHPVFAEDMPPLLGHYDVDRFIVGHCKGENVFKLRDRKVVVIDVNHSRNREEGRARALKIERTADGDRLTRVKDGGEREAIEVLTE
jgi:hypothetical protein